MANNSIQGPLHKMGIRGIFIAIGKWKLFFKQHFIISFASSILIIYLTSLHEYTIDMLKLLSKSVTDFFPDILGVTLSAYAVVIGLGNVSVLKKLSRPSGKNRPTLYQMLNGMFAMGLLLQIFTLIYANSIQFIIAFIEKDNEQIILFPTSLLFILILVTVWAFLILLTIIFMLFNIGQIQNWEMQNQDNPKGDL